MQILETAYHKIYTSQSRAPEWACLGPCKKVWWNEDLGEVKAPAILKCCACNGGITAATKEHYTVVFWDGKEPNPKEMQIGYASEVKPEFIEKAKKEWLHKESK